MNQTDVLLDELKLRNLTTKDIHMLGMGRPGDVVFKLRKLGHNIATKLLRVKTRWGVSVIAEYRLEP